MLFYNAERPIEEQEVVLRTTACTLESSPKNGAIVCDKSLLSAPYSRGITETSPVVKAILSAFAVFLSVGACAFAGLTLKRFDHPPRIL